MAQHNGSIRALNPGIPVSYLTAGKSNQEEKKAFAEKHVVEELLGVSALEKGKKKKETTTTIF